MFKYSYDSLVYFGEPVDRSIARLARFGYDAIELIGEPAKYGTKEVTRLAGDHGIKVSSICLTLGAVKCADIFCGTPLEDWEKNEFRLSASEPRRLSGNGRGC
jgi:sugar phosphate isomerase/epimerase